MDCVAICSPRVGQEAARGLTRARAWRTRVAEIAQRLAGQRPTPGRAGSRPSRSAVLRLGPASVHRPGDVRRRAGPGAQPRHARHPGTAFLPDDRGCFGAPTIDEPPLAATLAGD